MPSAPDRKDVLELSIDAWFSDTELSHCSEAARGVWIDLLLRMRRSGRSGAISGTVDELARLVRSTPQTLATLLRELRDKRVAEIEGRIAPGGRQRVTVRNRRMVREAHQRTAARERQRRRRRCEELRRYVLQRDCHTCGYCRGDAGTVDHVTPLSRGGHDDPSNAVAACANCNQIKGERTPEEAGMALSKRAVTLLSREKQRHGHAHVTPDVTLPQDSPPLSPTSPPSPHRDKRRDKGVTASAWPQIRSSLERSLDGEEFATWVRPLRPGRETSELLELVAPNGYFCATAERTLRAHLDRCAEAAGLRITITSGDC